ncbi:hypothetical protein SLEP1_g206 [Rubroshorea leprosula]|uniref:3,8-divinyl protochlorophyllide a 8-vinyl-reductase (NADPH) n=1 Tax=Rubroshorea leprosula TaxID=152421 RepID=A0AAV5HKP8_9ROSI|nr:hypothetical protein SLEP1_g206 [Rubroshorea leprosula]
MPLCSTFNASTLHSARPPIYKTRFSCQSIREIQGFNVIAIARERSGIRRRNSKEDTLNELQGANVFFSDVTNLGTSENSLQELGRKLGASHFVLLSAMCVQKPLLEFQRAKLKFEAELMKEAELDNGFTYSIVRPTAFFKSLGIFPAMEDAAEFRKIGRYYAAESMLVLDPETGGYSAEKTPSYGKTLEEFFERVLTEGMAGQELGEQTIF